ncbi:MAG: MTAP family purine nucleoside phosphorylase [Actinomycetota bacterium]|nr:MTAP family purine nucleoside phosphorylase [Acidimicrobiia bacterium]MDQ3468179.1 MTAP family purine nucleoside phosphorylase [Actinomycetota bacterium]
MLIPIGDQLAEVGVFGGSGFYELQTDATAAEDVELDTPYGAPAGPITIATVAGRRVAFLPRHGREHTYAAHRVPFRANVWALASLGVRCLLGPCSAVSLRRGMEPGDFVVVDQLVDRTWGRRDTFHDVGGDEPTSGGVHHQSFAEPFDTAVRAVLVDAVRAAGAQVHDGATMVVVNGPRSATRAEHAWFRDMGWDIVNMTGYPEAVLAAEAGVPYASVALVADCDAGGAADATTAPVVPTVMHDQVERLRAVLAAAVPLLP